MAGRPASAGDLNQLSTIFRFGVVGHLSDSQLLQSFRTGRDEAGQAAFSAIVERHGPMVLSVCRQVLRNSHDADDAFQATFLVMARRAGTVQNTDSLASWLHGVALRVAVRAKADEARRTDARATFCNAETKRMRWRGRPIRALSGAPRRDRPFAAAVPGARGALLLGRADLRAGRGADRLPTGYCVLAAVEGAHAIARKPGPAGCGDAHGIAGCGVCAGRKGGCAAIAPRDDGQGVSRLRGTTST